MLGEVEAGGRRWVEARDLSGIRLRCTRPDGSRADELTGFSDGDGISRFHLRITPTRWGTGYDHTSRVRLAVQWYKFRRWVGL